MMVHVTAKPSRRMLAAVVVYWQRAPAVLDLWNQNAKLGVTRSELIASCGYECSGIHLQQTP